MSAGLLVLENLPCEAVAEAAVAAALLLEHVPQAVSVLLRPGALNSLVDTALEEVASPGSDATLGVTPTLLPVMSQLDLWNPVGSLRGLLHSLAKCTPEQLAFREAPL